LNLPANLDLQGLSLLVLDGFILAFVILHGLTRNFDDSDRGAGNVVDLDPPLRPSYRRCALFLATSLVVSVLIVALRQPNLLQVYRRLVGYVLGSAVHDPAAVQLYSRSVLPVFQANVLVFGVAFAVAFHASVARRIVILANVALGLTLSLLVDAFFGLFVLETHLPLGPTPLVNVFLQYLFAGVVLLRIEFTSFQLPNKTPLPLRRGRDWGDDLVLVASVLAATASTAGGALWLDHRLGGGPLTTSVIVFACPPWFFFATTLFLGLVRLLRFRRVDPGPERPPIEVIVPAFNEETVIERLLRSLDVAAGRYGGPVRVILCDDGSTDGTFALAERVMADFRHADGEIILGEHAGKSAALNQALAHCRADYVFRFDADCEAHPECFVYAVPYFLADHRVGLVGAFTLPKEPYTTWIDHLRMFEVIVLFGLARPAADVVDGIFCIPGTFTGFRRVPALAIGGFIEGMYGEDAEFTYAMTRLGWRAVMDTRIRSYEDVPNTQRQLRIQRTRWNRGGTMAFARNVPVVTGLSGPRNWFFAARQGVKRTLMPLRLSLLTFILAEVFFAPSAQLNLARFGAIVGLRILPALLETACVALYYNKWRHLPYLLLQPVFAFLKHYYALEAFLSFNARPVITGRVADALRPVGRIGPLDEPARAVG
jgi:cellulose synthase/poly-beta-1,6-N-acetylglucosamine synthase-like glycosyltransferase